MLITTYPQLKPPTQRVVIFIYLHTYFIFIISVLCLFNAMNVVCLWLIVDKCKKFVYNC